MSYKGSFILENISQSFFSQIVSVIVGYFGDISSIDETNEGNNKDE